METTSILLTGVGGQGTILISKILATGLASMGYDVKMSEIHGMSQRGGTVNTQIKYGKKVYAPNIGPGEADIIVSFEKVETLRALPYLKKGGTIVSDEKEIYSMPVLTGDAEYPHNALELIEAAGCTLKRVSAAKIAAELGNSKVQNIVLLGALLKALKIDSEIDWKEIIKNTVPAKLADLNLEAYARGAEL
ncbi:MAG: indolepyruvate oxidoreductase subunit beta [Oscillospiraceae bacterium]|nr:indolepyruvate oxidoreductase subunit beta [Oscillospiraceae bacterium]